MLDEPGKCHRVLPKRDIWDLIEQSRNVLQYINTNLAQEGFAGGVLPRARLLWMAQTGDGGLQGHGRGERLVYARCIAAADGGAGVWVIAPRWVSPSLCPHLSKKERTDCDILDHFETFI